MNKGTLLLFLFLTSITSLSARVGETEPELVKRFGKVVLRMPEKTAAEGRMFDVGERLVFKNDLWNITAVLVAGRCEKINYSKPGEWAEAQFSSLLTSNAGKYAWREIPSRNPKLKRDWKRDDGATAAWMSGAGFTVSTPTYEAKIEAIKKSAKAAATKAPNF